MAGSVGSWFKKHRVALVVGYVLLLAGSHAYLRLWAKSDPLQEPGKILLEVEGQRLAYMEWGGANPKLPPLILLHGSPAGGARDFQRFAEELAPTGRRIIAIDRWGYGASEPRVDDYSFEADARAVLGLMDQLGIERAHLGGWSYGAAPALILAEENPQRIRSVTMLAGIGVQKGEGSGSHLVEHAKYVAGYGLAMALPEVVPHFGAFGSRNFRRAFLRDFMDCDQRGMEARLLNLQVPLLLVHGKHDPLVPAWVAQAHRELQPRSRLVILNASHFFPFGMRDSESFRIAVEEQSSFLAAADRGRARVDLGERNETSRENLRTLWDGGPALRGYKPWWVVMGAGVIVGLLVPRTGGVLVGLASGLLVLDFVTAIAGVVLGAVCRRGESRTRFHKAVGVLLWGIVGLVPGSILLPFA